jgi:hypothetical protein
LTLLLVVGPGFEVPQRPAGLFHRVGLGLRLPLYDQRHTRMQSLIGKESGRRRVANSSLEAQQTCRSHGVQWFVGARLPIGALPGVASRLPAAYGTHFRAWRR